MKVSIRFGMRLGWPITNAATFVTKINEEDFNKFYEAVESIRIMLRMAGSVDIAERLIFERR